MPRPRSSKYSVRYSSELRTLSSDPALITSEFYLVTTNRQLNHLDLPLLADVRPSPLLVGMKARRDIRFRCGRGITWRLRSYCLHQSRQQAECPAPTTADAPSP